MSTFYVKYYAGLYSGIKSVKAEDADEAIGKVRAWVRRTMTLPMYASGYKIVNKPEGD